MTEIKEHFVKAFLVEQSLPAALARMARIIDSNRTDDGAISSFEICAQCLGILWDEAGKK